MRLPSPDDDPLVSPACLGVDEGVLELIRLSLSVQDHNHTVAIVMLLIPAQINTQPPDVAKTRRIKLIYFLTS